MNFDHVVNRNIIKDNDTIRNYEIVLFVRTYCACSQKLYQECVAQNVLGSLKIINIDVPLGKKTAIEILGHLPLTTPVCHSMVNKKTVYAYSGSFVNTVNELISPIYSNI